MGNCYVRTGHFNYILNGFVLCQNIGIRCYAFKLHRMFNLIAINTRDCSEKVSDHA